MVELQDSDEVIAHFGGGFDVPWLRARVVYHGLKPMPLFKIVDTKAWASRHFLFNSNKLDYLAKFFGSDGKIKTEWSWWRDILLNNCKATLAKMVYYCKKDVVELEFVWKRLVIHVPAEVHAGVVAGFDKWTCPLTGSKNVAFSKRRVTATGQVRYQMQNQESGNYYSITQLAYDQYIKSKSPALQKVSRVAAPGNRNHQRR